MDIVEKLQQTVKILRSRKCGIHAGYVQEAIQEIECLRLECKVQNPGSAVIDNTGEVDLAEPAIDPPKSPHEGTMLEGYLQHTEEQDSDQVNTGGSL